MNADNYNQETVSKIPEESTHDPKGIVNTMLQTALDIHHQRECVYGWITTQNVFEDAAKIASIMLRKQLDSKDITVIFTAMKMARFGNTMELIEHFKNDSKVLPALEKSIYDSALDGMVYMALAERERQKCMVSDSIQCKVSQVTPLFPKRIKSGLPLCPFISWIPETIDGGEHSPDDVSISRCCHPYNPDSCEGNCQPQNCPMVRGM
jgi:hypothetical protein